MEQGFYTQSRCEKIDLISDEIWRQFEGIKDRHSSFTAALRALIEEPLLHISLGQWPRALTAATMDDLAAYQESAKLRNETITSLNKKAQEQRSDLIVPRPAGQTGQTCQDILTAAP